MKDEVFNKVENKTNVDKATILELAKQINDNGLKDEKTLKSVINKLSIMTGKNVSKEMEEKIINTILEDKVPKDIEKMF
ncbi:MAG: stage VI sporulation protein F [Bacilli bacterium]|nr:stage VI sporulation protein F [Bacilli bacterium]MDD4407380.1 stage VI sporulation protein F [Bacilli bacterium]